MAFREKKQSHNLYVINTQNPLSAGAELKESQMSLQRFCTLLSAFNLSIILQGQFEGNILQELNPIENN